MAARKSLDGRLEVVHAYSESAHPFAQTAAIRETHAAAMDDLLGEYNIPPDDVHLKDEKPAMAILHCSTEIGADIVVLGALSRSRLAEKIIGNTADRVLDYIKADLYIVKPKKQ